MSFPNVKVVGMHFRGAEAKELASALSAGDRLELEREPTNAYDMNAIKVIHPGTGLHIGYVEAGQAAWIASELDELSPSGSVECTVTELQQIRNNIHPIVEIVIADD